VQIKKGVKQKDRSTFFPLRVPKKTGRLKGNQGSRGKAISVFRFSGLLDKKGKPNKKVKLITVVAL